MAGTVDTGLFLLMVLMLALGLGPALLALASRRAPVPLAGQRFFFGAATAARAAARF